MVYCSSIGIVAVASTGVPNQSKMLPALVSSNPSAPLAPGATLTVTVYWLRLPLTAATVPGPSTAKSAARTPATGLLKVTSNTTRLASMTFASALDRTDYRGCVLLQSRRPARVSECSYWGQLRRHGCFWVHPEVRLAGVENDRSASLHGHAVPAGRDCESRATNSPH